MTAMGFVGDDEKTDDLDELCACGCGGLPKMSNKPGKRTKYIAGHRATPVAPDEHRFDLNPAIRRPCSETGCGDVEPKTTPPDGWTYVLVAGSREPGRWFCSGACGTYGIAIAELRPATPNPEGETHGA